jgi:arylsulfatase A-like enzyme
MLTIKALARAAIAALLMLFALGVAAAPAAPPTPNILFIIMDDVGIDQMRLFGYGGVTPPSTPNIDRIANGGVRFDNAWAMPACSTSRAVFFTGRFPLRTNVFGALGPDDLANSMVSPYEMTVPKLLRKRGYHSALFGKFHLGLQGNSPFQYAMPASLGWNYFSGWLDETGDPSSIDTTAGGVAAGGKSYSCGFVPGAADGGADAGACYSANDGCQPMTTTAGIPPGRTCRDGGGIFDPGKTCAIPTPGYVDFTKLSGHYVSPLVINHEDGRPEKIPSTDIRARSFRGTVPVDAAIEWIQRQPPQKPWMATVSFASAHTPLMQPPPALLAADAAATSGFDCNNVNEQRVLMNQMVEALDTEVGRLLVAIGVAQRGPDGGLIYVAAQTDTMVVIVGDNGSLGGVVKVPFDTSRAKGTAYQTGVWVPLVVAGPLVKAPNRAVTKMVNIADLFQLFGEIAGIDVHKAVPRTIDSTAMLPYLVNPDQGSIRKWNFTQVGVNYQANGTLNGPCQIASTCTQIPVTKSVCEDNGGIWWGAKATDPVTAGIPATGLLYCCDVNIWRANQGQSTYTIQPLDSVAIRNDHYKIVSNFVQDYDEAANACAPVTTNEFYAINEAVPVPLIDTAELDLIPLGPLTPDQQSNYNSLSAQLTAVLGSQPACPGDGNIDGAVNGHDLNNWLAYALASGKSSWYDINMDGLTNLSDLALIKRNLGACP